MLSAGVVLAAVLCISCGGRTARPDAGTETHSGDAAGTATAGAGRVSHRLTMPVPPAMLTSDSARLDYVAQHYWDSMDLRDTTWIADTAALEQVYANYLGLLGHLPEAQAEERLAAFHGATEVCPAMRDRLFEVAERYLYDPNSPMRSEGLYIAVLRWAVSSPSLDEYEKIRTQDQLDMALRNRPGMTAADFAYTTADGRTHRLADFRGERTLLFFYNPDCPDCARVKEYIASSPTLSPLIAAGRVKVLAVYTDEDLKLWRERLPQMPAGWTVGYNTQLHTARTYDLRAIPCLYLLNARKHVVLKDAPVEWIETWLQQNAG